MPGRCHPRRSGAAEVSTALARCSCGLRPGRPQAAPESAQDEGPRVSRLAWLLVRNPAGLGDADRAVLGQLHAGCPTAAMADFLLQKLMRMVRARTSAPLEAWFNAASTWTCRTWHPSSRGCGASTPRCRQRCHSSAASSTPPDHAICGRACDGDKPKITIHQK